VSGVSVAQCEAEGVCGHGLASSFYIWRMRLAALRSLRPKIEWDESRPPRRSRPAMNSCKTIHTREAMSAAWPTGWSSRSFGGAVHVVAKRPPFRSAVASAQRPVENMPSSTTMTPQPATTDHAAWLACTKPTELEATIAPVTATPTAAPVWRKVEAIAPATPAWSRACPKVQYW